MDKHIQKSNRKYASGGGLPEAETVAHFWAAIALYATEKDDFTEKAVALIMFQLIRGRRIKTEPVFGSEYSLTRIKCDENIMPNAVRITKDHGISWLEFSHQLPECAKSRGPELIWLPTPAIFNHFLLKLVRKFTKSGSLLFNAKDLSVANTILKKASKTASNHGISAKPNRAGFFNFIKYCARADTCISPLAKLAWFGTQAAPHEHIAYYLQLTSDEVRAQITHALNRYLERLQSTLTRLLSTKNSLALASFEAVPKKPTYLTNSSTEIPEFKGTRRVKSEQDLNYFKPSFFLGCNRSPSQKKVVEMLKTLTNQLNNTHKKVHTTHSLAKRLNAWSALLCARFILFTGIRPTHHIGPDIGLLMSEGFTIYDKGCWRSIPLTSLFREEVDDYLRFRKKVINTLPTQYITISPNALLLIIDESTKSLKPITVAWLKRYLKSLNITVMPYAFRRYFAQSLSKNGCPAHILSALMGHYRYGEQAGVTNILEPDDIHMVQWLQLHEKSLRETLC